MKILKAILLAFILTCTLAAGVFFVLSVPSITDFIHEERITLRDTEESHDVTSMDVLSRLSMYPSQKKGRKLIAVVIENHEDARPYQQGLMSALLVQEFLVEGLISRFVAVFDTRNLPGSIGPVRSLRSYFLDGLKPWVSVVLHAGGSPDALERTENDPFMHAFNGLFLPDHFLREKGIPAPHDLFIKRSAIRDLLPDTITPTPWPPYTVDVSGDQPLRQNRISSVRVTYFNPKHNVEYTFNPWFKWYGRKNGGIETGVRPHNLLMIEAPIEGVGEFGRLSIHLTGSGKLMLFSMGRRSVGIWSKAGSGSAFRFLNSFGEPLIFVAGQTWITYVPTLERVSWE